MNESSKLLFLSHVLPFPPDGGVKIRAYHLLKLAAREYDVTALCFHRSEGADWAMEAERAVAHLSEFCEVECYRIAQQHSAIRWTWDHLRSVLTGRPYTYYVYSSTEYRRSLADKLSAVDFDLIHVESLDLVRYLPALRTFPVVCDHHNVESHLLLQRADLSGSSIRCMYLRFQAARLHDAESTWCPRVDVNLVVSGDDARLLGQRAPGAKITVVPNGVDIEEFRPRSDPNRGKGIVFVGGTTWEPNRDGLRYFANQILPKLSERVREQGIVWVGRSTEAEQRQYAHEFDIEMTGYVDDVRPYFDAARCFIVPLRMGGGSRLKILDAWAMGKAVVSTSVGCSGLEAEDGHNILIRDDPASFAQALENVIADAALRNRLERGARETAVNKYAWDVVGEKLYASYDSILGSAYSH